MAYPYGNPDQHPFESSAGYGAYWPRFTDSANQRTSPANRLVWLVLALGLATYLVSYAAVLQPGDIGWAVRFSTLAAVVAALGLPPRHSAHTKFMVALAVMGCLEALSLLVIGDQSPSGATIAIVVLNALQAVTAIAALLARLREPSAGARRPAPYDAYAYYAPAAQQYYAENNQQSQQEPVQAQGMAQADVAASARAQQYEAERYALYAEYLGAQQFGPNPAASSRQPGERTQTNQFGAGMPTSAPAERVGWGSDPATGSPTQSFP